MSIFEKIQIACDWVLTKQEKGKNKGCQIVCLPNQKWFDWEKKQISPAGACIWYLEGQNKNWRLSSPASWEKKVAEYLGVSIYWVQNWCYHLSLTGTVANLAIIDLESKEISFENKKLDYNIILNSEGISGLEVAYHFLNLYPPIINHPVQYLPRSNAEVIDFYQNRIIQDLRRLQAQR